MQDKSLLTLKEASKFLSLSHQSISSARRLKRLKSIKKNNRNYFLEEDLLEYKNKRWLRDRHFNEKYMSAKQAASVLNVNLNRIYYMLQTGILKYRRKGCMYLVPRSEILNRNIA